MSVFGIGTWQMGGRFEKDPDNNDKADIEAIREAIDLGVTHIDTAELYADGHAEELVGQAIKGYSREKLFIVSKVDTPHFKYDLVIASCEASLKRLGTDYLDVYLLHAPPDDGTTIEEPVGALNELVKRGLVKNIGVSNFAMGTLQAAQKASRNIIVTNQVHYNLRIREAEDSGLLKYAQENDVMITAYRPLEKGMLAKVTTLMDLSRKYGKTPYQVAINWLISQDNVVTIAKSTSTAHLKENLGGIGWNLTDEDVELLRKEFPNQEKISDVMPLE